MFRELSQKKNIITLVLIVWLLVEYFCLPIMAITHSSSPEENNSVIQEEIIVEQIKIEVEVELELNSEIQKTETENLNSVEESITIESETETNESVKQQEVIVSAPSKQTAVESEVIDEYFDDAQIIGEYAVPSINTNFKSYTNYTLLSKRSIQWKLQERAYTDENGLRKIGNYYLAAMGSYYSTTIGDKFRLTTDTGAVFDIILCDAKSDLHTDSRHMYTVFNKCMVEFYVDTTKLNSYAKRMGSLGVLPQFSGSIVKVESLGTYEW